MSNLNFPSSPVDGETYSLDNISYVYDASTGAWISTVILNAPLTTVLDKQILFNDNNTPNGSFGATFDKTSNTVFFNDAVVTLNVSATYFKGNGALLTGVVSDFSPAFNQANLAVTIGSSAYDQANTSEFVANLAYDYANSINLIAIAAFDQANNSTIGIAAYDKANIAQTTAIAAYDQTNTNSTITTASFDKVNAVAIGANAYADLVGAGANAFASATISGANVAVGSGANAYADVVGSSSNSYLLSVIAGANTDVGAGANTVGSAAFDKANNAETIAISAYDEANTKLSSSGGTISGDLDITGNLHVFGNVTTFTTNNLVVNDPFILLANNNTADVLDIGFVAHYVNATAVVDHTGLFRSAGTKEWYLFKNYSEHFFYDGGSIDLTGNNFTLDILNSDIRTSNLILGGQNTIIWINSAYDKANAANVLAYGTGIGANTFTSATIAGANTAVGAGANAYANLVWSRANVSMNLDSVNATRYIVFDDAVTGTLSRANVSYGLTYTPSSNTLTASGNLIVGTSTSTTKFDLSGSFAQNIVAVAASAVDCSAGNYFTKTVSGALNWTVTNIPASRSYSFLLELTNGGSGTQTWFSGTKWASGTAPTLTTSGVDLLGFITDDGGTTWNGIVIGKDLR